MEHVSTYTAMSLSALHKYHLHKIVLPVRTRCFVMRQRTQCETHVYVDKTRRPLRRTKIIIIIYSNRSKALEDKSKTNASAKQCTAKMGRVNGFDNATKMKRIFLWQGGTQCLLADMALVDDDDELTAEVADLAAVVLATLDRSKLDLCFACCSTNSALDDTEEEDNDDPNSGLDWIFKRFSLW